MERRRPRTPYKDEVKLALEAVTPQPRESKAKLAKRMYELQMSMYKQYSKGLFELPFEQIPEVNKRAWIKVAEDKLQRSKEGT